MPNSLGIGYWVLEIMKHVIVFGVFDLLHPGHLYFLQQAKKHGSHLTVIIARDERVIQEKRHKPFFSAEERLKLVGALKIVDRVMLGDKGGEWRIIKKLRPDVVCVGYDQDINLIKRCGEFKKTPKLVQIKAYRSTRYASSKIKQIC